MRVYRDDQKFLTFRINALLWAIVVVFVFLAGSFWVVQGVQADKYRNLSEANALRELVMPAKRGLILDRSGQKILADNQPAYLALARPRDHATDRQERSVASPEGRRIPLPGARHAAAGHRGIASKKGSPSRTPIPSRSPKTCR